MERDPRDQTVGEYIFKQCSESMLMELAAVSGYWSSAYEMIGSVRERAMGTLPYKQRDWLVRIKEQLIEKAKKQGETDV